MEDKSPKQETHVNVAEAFKSLTFRTFLRLDEVEDQSAVELQLRAMIMQLAQHVTKELGAQQQQAPQQVVQQKQQQRKQQRNKGSQTQALKQQKIQQSLRQANQLGKVQTEGVLDKAKQVGAFRAGLGALGQLPGMLGQGVRKRAQEFGAASPVGKFLRGAAERYAEKLAGERAKTTTQVAPATTTAPAVAAPAAQPETVPAEQGRALQAARGQARRPQATPQPTSKTPATASPAARAARGAQIQGAAQVPAAATPVAQLTQNITQGLQRLSAERRMAVINTAVEGLTSGKRNTPQNVAVAKKVREILLKSLQGQGA